MADRARTEEAGFWRTAGIVPGATVADVGCGPAAVAVQVAELHRRNGNDLQVGLGLRHLLEAAGLEVEVHEGRYLIAAMPPGMRPPSWAAGDALRDEGIAAEDDLRRWAAAFERTDAAPVRPTTFAPVAVGRRR